MSIEENKQCVSAGLAQRRADRNEREAQQELQEQQLRRTINDNHTARTMTAIQRQEAEAEAIRQRRREREAARQAAAAKEMKADRAVRFYALICLMILLAVATTKLPLWAGATLALGLMAVLAAYIYRVFVPWEG